MKLRGTPRSRLLKLIYPNIHFKRKNDLENCLQGQIESVLIVALSRVNTIFFNFKSRVVADKDKALKERYSHKGSLVLSITIGFIVWIICRKSEKRRVNEKIINHVNVLLILITQKIRLIWKLIVHHKALAQMNSEDNILSSFNASIRGTHIFLRWIIWWW